MLINRAMSREMETCIYKSHRDLTKQYNSGAQLDIGGGGAFYSGSDSFFSQVLGWGFDIKSEKQFTRQIAAIEKFYIQQNHSSVDIELSPLAGDEIANLLNKRGYWISEMNNISVLNLVENQYPLFFNNDYQVQKLTESDDLKLWAKAVAKGFEHEAAEGHFERYAQIPSVQPFAIFIDNKIAAGGSIAIYDDICDLAVTSTLKEYRGRGLQKLLLKERLSYAQKQGAKVATVTTAPGSISDLNIQKLGFRTAYTRLKFSRELYTRDFSKC